MRHFSETNPRRFAQQHWFRADGVETKALMELQANLTAFLTHWAGVASFGEEGGVQLVQDREVLTVGFRLWLTLRGMALTEDEPVWPAEFHGLAVMICPPLHEDHILDLLQRHPMGVLLWRRGTNLHLQVALVLPHPHDQVSRENRLSVFPLSDGGWGCWTPSGLKLASDGPVAERDLTGWVFGSEHRFNWDDPRAEALWEASLSKGASREGLRNLADRLRLPSKEVKEDLRAWGASLASWGDRVCEVLAKTLLPLAVPQPGEEPTFGPNGWWYSRRGMAMDYSQAAMFFTPKSKDGGMVWVLLWERRASRPGQFQYRTLGLEEPDIKLRRNYLLNSPADFDLFCQELLEVAEPKCRAFMLENQEGWDLERARRT